MDIYLLIGCSLAIAAIASTRFAQHFGVPALVLFVGIGMLAGSSGPGGIVFGNYALSLNVGLVALAVILFSGGLDTNASLFKASLLPAGLLATVGVLLKMLLVSVLVVLVTPLSFAEALLLGAVLAPTDAAAVFSVLKGRGLPERLRGVLEAESGTNDPVSIYLTLTLATFITTGQASLVGLVGGIVVQLILGGVLGYLFGRLFVLVINRVSVDSYGLYPVLALAGGLLSYAATNLLGGNGFLAIYVMGLVLGNHRLSHRQDIRNFMDGAAWAAQIGMFLLLGLLVFPDRLVAQLPVAFLITLWLVLIARPLSVVLTLLPLRALGRYRFSKREQVLLAWAGLKGAVPIILAIVPLLNRVPNGELIFNVAFVVVITGTALQGLTVVPLARHLGLLAPEPPEPPMRIELGGAAPPGSSVFDVFLDADNSVVGQTLRSLRLPQNLVVAAVYRKAELVTPRGSLVFEPGDHVFLISSDVEAAEVPSVFITKQE